MKTIHEMTKRELIEVIMIKDATIAELRREIELFEVLVDQMKKESEKP